MSCDDAYGRLLRLVAPCGAYNWIERPPDSASWLTRRRGVLKPEHLRLGHPVGIRPSPGRASFVVLDVDKNSRYHPSRNPCGVGGLRTHLAHHGIEGVINVQSSASTGIHLWAPLPEQSTCELARWLFRVVTSGGFEVAPGVLELFPNVVTPGKLHNGIRLPLIAPDSWILNDDLNPVHQNIRRFIDQWVNYLECNVDFTLESIASGAPPAARTGRPAEAWERLKRGWSGAGQTWPLAHDAAFIACCEGLRGTALQSRMCKLMSQAPGCQAWSRHWRDINSGRYCPDLAEYYSQQGAKYRARNQGSTSQPRSEKPARDPEYNTKVSARRRSVLTSTARDLKESGMRFHTMTAAIDSLIMHLKKTTGTGMSKSTIYKKHLDLVMPLVETTPSP
jgi:hypothetical protein